MSQHRSKSGSRSKHDRLRQRPPRRKPVDPEASIDKVAERARLEAVLTRLEPEMLRLFPQALEQRLDHALYVLDPHSALLRALPGEADLLADFRETLGHDTAVTIFPVATLERLLRMVATGYPRFLGLVEELLRVPPPGFVRRVIQVGHSFQVDLVTATTAPGGDDGCDTYEALATRCAFTPGEEIKGAKLPGGRTEDVVTVAGMLKMVFFADARNPESASMRDLIERFQRVARGPVEAESLQPNPREVDAVLMDLFGGAELEAAVDRACGGPGTSGKFDLVGALGPIVERLERGVS